MPSQVLSICARLAKRNRLSYAAKEYPYAFVRVDMRKWIDLIARRAFDSASARVTAPHIGYFELTNARLPAN